MTHLPGTSVHLIADLSHATGLSDLALIEATLRQAALAAGAKVLSVHVHAFGGDMGVTGIALLAESHISIHTWPETGEAAIDLFVCGKEVNAECGLAVIVENFAAVINQTFRIERLSKNILTENE